MATTVGEWYAQTWLFGQIVQDVMGKVATEIKADDLAEEILANTERTFPMDRYRRALNERSKGAGDRAVKLAGR